MSQSVQPYQDPAATPVGTSGTRVEIRERAAWTISGWWGVLVVIACVVAVVLLVHTSVKALVAAPMVVAIVILGSLVIVQPGQTRVVQFAGS